MRMILFVMSMCCWSLFIVRDKEHAIFMIWGWLVLMNIAIFNMHAMKHLKRFAFYITLQILGIVVCVFSCAYVLDYYGGSIGYL